MSIKTILVKGPVSKLAQGLFTSGPSYAIIIISKPTETTMTQATYQVWTGFDIDEMELFDTFTTEEEALASAENCADFADLVEIVEDYN